MIGLDTNVIVRYLTHDDPVQTPVAIRFLNSLSPASPGFLSLVALAELVWVLSSLYRCSKHEIEDALETLLRSEVLVLERSDIVWQALRKFRSSNAGFSDCLIACCGHAAECDYTATFDKRAAAAGMKLIG
ncbi:MAG TPA: type II toxin-antitoxin system VapC family toxin [Candidatus Sulfotelmatobacter sp.]|nr:type II toxin-antitoxin system VapC family toxin [Candidatus Sulfotelmatobacter sp.]